jgi:hypothetical protein
MCMCVFVYLCVFDVNHASYVFTPGAVRVCSCVCLHQVEDMADDAVGLRDLDVGDVMADNVQV